MKKFVCLICLIMITKYTLAQGWEEVYSGSSFDLDAIHFIDESIGYAAGGFTDILRTTDGGATWATTDDIGARDFSFYDSEVGYSASRVGESMAKTVNGGVTWTAITPVNGNSLWGVATVSPTTAYFVGTGGVLWRTTNSGQSFTILNSGTSNLITDIFFTSEQVGYLTAQLTGLRKTTNGGSSWTTIWTGNSSTEMHFVTEQIGYVVGPQGRIIKTTDAGANWEQLVTNSNDILFGVHFYDINHGIVVGSGGTILYTNDAGLTWDRQETGISLLLNDVRMLSPTSAVVVGDNDTILKNDNIVLSVADNDIQNVNVFPNPASNSIKVNSDSFIEHIKIYNVLGQEVASYSVQEFTKELDISNLSDGNYFLKVYSGKAVHVIRFIKI